MRRDDYGELLRTELQNREITPFVGIYDVFSATLAARHFEGLFISGFSFAASFYGLPDIGFIAWPDIVAFCQRLRAVLPRHHIMVDIDDGYGDTETAAHVVSLLKNVGASGVIMEDQLRPRRCGHLDAKQLLDLNQYLAKLEKVLAVRKDMVVVARTDAVSDDDIMRRIHAYADAGADAVLIDGLRDLHLIRRLKAKLDVPVMFNQIAGGKSPPYTLAELRAAGVSLVNYRLPDGIGIKECNAILNANLRRRDED